MYIKISEKYNSKYPALIKEPILVLRKIKYQYDNYYILDLEWAGSKIKIPERYSIIDEECIQLLKSKKLERILKK